MHSYELKNDHVRVTVSENKDGFPVVTMERSNGGRYGPVPLVGFDTYLSFCERIESPGQPVRVRQWTPIEQGLHLELYDRGSQISVGLLLELAGERLRLTLKMSELAERDDSAWRLYGVRFLPGLMTVGEGGSVLLPLSCGRMFSPAGAPPMEDTFLIYGEQKRWELLPMLPVASVGACGEGVIAVAAQCPEDASVRVWTDGKGRGGIDMGACLRENWTDPVDTMDRTIEFVPAPLDPDLLHTTARILRRHVVEDLGMRPIAERAGESEWIRYLTGAMTVKLFFGVLDQGCGRAHPQDPSHGQYLNCMTFAEATAALKKIKAAGVDALLTESVGFLPNGHDGCYPSHDCFDTRIGGRDGFSRMVEAGKKLGFAMNVHDNYNEGYEISPDFDWRWCSHDIHGQPQQRGRWGGGQSYLQCMRALPEDRVEGALARMKAMGLSGTGYIDAIGNPLYRNYHLEHGGPRRHHAEGIERVLKAAGATYGGVSTECGFLYAARHCTTVCMPSAHYQAHGIRAHWPLGSVDLELVPLYLLALSGLLMIDRHGHGKRGIIEQLLLGLHPHFGDFTMRHAGCGIQAFNDKLVREMKFTYDTVCTTFRHLQGQRVIRWEKNADGTEQTAYADGTDVRADFAGETVAVNGAKLKTLETYPG